ncbi:unnamed protein product [Chrysoparadoxa australica]
MVTYSSLQPLCLVPFSRSPPPYTLIQPLLVVPGGEGGVGPFTFDVGGAKVTATLLFSRALVHCRANGNSGEVEIDLREGEAVAVRHLTALTNRLVPPSREYPELSGVGQHAVMAIGSFLEARDLARLTLIGKNIGRMAQNDMLWQALLLKDFRHDAAAKRPEQPARLAYMCACRAKVRERKEQASLAAGRWRHATNAFSGIRAVHGGGLHFISPPMTWPWPRDEDMLMSAADHQAVDPDPYLVSHSTIGHGRAMGMDPLWMGGSGRLRHLRLR